VLDIVPLCSGSQEEPGRIYYTPLAKAKQIGRHIGVLFESLSLNILLLTELVQFCSAKLPHSGQSSQLFSDSNNGNA
jgi:hypothetical protein